MVLSFLLLLLSMAAVAGEEGIAVENGARGAAAGGRPASAAEDGAEVARDEEVGAVHAGVARVAEQGLVGLAPHVGPGVAESAEEALLRCPARHLFLAWESERGGGYIGGSD